MNGRASTWGYLAASCSKLSAIAQGKQSPIHAGSRHLCCYERNCWRLECCAGARWNACLMNFDSIAAHSDMRHHLVEWGRSGDRVPRTPSRKVLISLESALPEKRGEEGYFGNLVKILVSVWAFSPPKNQGKLVGSSVRKKRWLPSAHPFALDGELLPQPVQLKSSSSRKNSLKMPHPRGSSKCAWSGDGVQ